MTGADDRADLPRTRGEVGASAAGASAGSVGTGAGSVAAEEAAAAAEAARRAKAKAALKAAAKKARKAAARSRARAEAEHAGAATSPASRAVVTVRQAGGQPPVGVALTIPAGPDNGRRVAPSTRLRRFIAVLGFAGPGIIAANAGNDAGGIITYASAGAEFAYRTLFFMVLVTVALVVVQEMCARLGVFTGKGLAALIREEFSLRVAAFAMICLVIANVGLVVSEFAGIGAALQLFGISKYLSIPISALAIWALVLFGSYRYAERIFLFLSLVFFAYPISALMAHPHWGTVASQLVYPHFLLTSRFLLLGVALIGTTITPYMQLYVAAAVADKGVSPEDYGYERIDTVGGAVFGNVISLFIIVATAAAARGSTQINSAGDAAHALEPVAGTFAAHLFGLGLFGASALAGAVVPLSTAYAISEAVGVERSVSRRFREAPLFLSLFTGQVVIGASVALVTSNLVQLLLVTQVLNGLITPVILGFILAMANRRSLLGDAANGPVFRLVSTVCVGLVGTLSLIVLTQTVLQIVGVA